ncbi:hypothetical protein NEOLI_002113 [Neolecta irregularis DAH-3]|uniref:Uncharacterized protein n=1 Tax=Neolecta irregularis (strain DAH-3) TaxID=1198029 RepID=A0A1U7LU98_NEOID|nr:hypothetical protein NEOLI_002113 [Neolecta irregularis DAH-3]|eukprot:OLL26153.1 hypothetical protein NEOLI_002113 [Neolecta irregularis DAH-3]
MPSIKKRIRQQLLKRKDPMWEFAEKNSGHSEGLVRARAQLSELVEREKVLQEELQILRTRKDEVFDRWKKIVA